MSIDNLLDSNRKEILDIASKHGAKEIRVFGSAARDEIGPESDVDILVEMKESQSLLDIVGIKQDIEDLIGKKVPIVTKAAISPYFRDEVLKEAVPL